QVSVAGEEGLELEEPIAIQCGGVKRHEPRQIEGVSIESQVSIATGSDRRDGVAIRVELNKVKITVCCSTAEIDFGVEVVSLCSIKGHEGNRVPAYVVQVDSKYVITGGTSETSGSQPDGDILSHPEGDGLQRRPETLAVLAHIHDTFGSAATKDV